MKINLAKCFIFAAGFLAGVVFIILSNRPSDTLYQWKNPSDTLVLSVATNGTDYNVWLSNHDYHRFFLTPFVNGRAVPRGTMMVVDENFSDYQNLKVEWLDNGCLITAKYGYQIYMPYPSDEFP